MKLKELLEGYNCIDISGDTDIDIAYIENDSRAVKNNTLFVAEKGYTVDGHDFIDMAIDKGAVAVLGESFINLSNIPYIQVKSSSDALSYLLNKLHNNPIEKFKTIGITGTNGKTSTSYFLKSIFESNSKKIGVIGTMGASLGEKKIELANTTPNAVILNKLLLDMLDNKTEFLAMEVSSHALALNRVKYMNFDVALFTNLSKDHLDYHGSMEDYFAAKKLLFKKNYGVNIINMDDSYGKKLIEDVGNGYPILSYGLDSRALIRAENLVYKIDGISYRLVTPRGEREISLNIPGRFSVYNSLAAAAVAYYYKISLDNIKTGLENIDSVKGRFEPVNVNKDYSIIIDFAHTPEGLKEILDAIKDFSKGKIITVFGAGGDRDPSKRPDMGRIVAERSDIGIITSDNPRNEDPEKIILDIELGYRKISKKYYKITNREDAIVKALQIANKGDVILLAGKGHETTMIIKDKSIPFDEREIIYKHIKNN